MGPARAGALEVETAGRVAILATPLDGRTIGESRRLLISLPGYTLRTQPGADPARPQRLVNYPNTKDWWTLEPEPAFAQKPSGNINTGPQPVWMARVETTVVLRTAAAEVTVYPLDGSGARMKPLGAADVTPVEGGFRLRLQAEGQALSPWYEVVAPQP